MTNSIQNPDTIYSLSNLQDIVAPAAPPFWPLAPGAWLVLLILLLSAGLLCTTLFLRRKQNRYRRAGLLLLTTAVTVHDVSVILKRVALAAFPQEQVASLYGADWQMFLEKSCTHCDFSSFIEKEASQKADAHDKSVAARWIQQHRIEQKSTKKD